MQNLGFDKKGVYVLVFFGSLLINKNLFADVIQAIMEIAPFFARKAVPYRILFFTDPDKYGDANKCGQELYEICLAKGAQAMFSNSK